MSSGYSVSTILVGVLALSVAGCSSGQPSVTASAHSEESADEHSNPATRTVADDHGAEAQNAAEAEEGAADSQPSDTAADGGTGSADERAATARDSTAPARRYSEEVSEIRRHFLEVRPDPIPDSLIHETHYWVSNENAHYVWRELIDDLGGVIAGVGTDQVYMMAAWAESEIIVPVDFDQEIVNIHFVYGAILQEAETPDAFLAFWRDDAEDEVRRLLLAFYEDPADATAPMAAWRNGHRRIYRRLERVQERYNDLGIGSFMNDADQFAYVRDKWRQGLVFPVRGDLTANTTLRDIGIACESVGTPMRVLYLSNAEQYFEYTPDFRRNIIAQHFDERSLLLRTRPMISLGVPYPGGDYHYNYQAGLNFAQWLAESRVEDGRDLLIRHRHRTGTEGLSVVNDDPPQTSRPPEVAAP